MNHDFQHPSHVINHSTLLYSTVFLHRNLTITMARRPKLVQHLPNPCGGKKKYIEVPLQYPSGSRAEAGAKRAASPEPHETSSKRSRSGPSLKDKVLERGSVSGTSREAGSNGEKVIFLMNSAMELKLTLVETRLIILIIPWKISRYLLSGIQTLSLCFRNQLGKEKDRLKAVLRER